MRFYKADGSYEIEKDSDFGWWLGDTFSVDDAIKLHLYNNHEKEDGEETLILEQGEFGESVGFTDLFECTNNIIIQKYEPSVHVQPVASVQQTQLSPEMSAENGYLILNNKKQGMWKDFENLNRARDELSQITSPSTLQSRILLAVMDFSKYRTLTSNNDPPEMNQTLHIPDLQKPSSLLIRPCIADNMEKQLHLQNRFLKKKQSLLQELVPINHHQIGQTENNCLTISSDSSLHNQKTPEKLSCVQSDSLKLSATVLFQEKFLECADLLYHNLKELSRKTEEMKKQLIDIRMGLQEEDRRSARLLQEFKKVSQELKESNYLNEILHLLMGQAEKVKSNNWPFRICSNRDDKELNLII